MAAFGPRRALCFAGPLRTGFERDRSEQCSRFSHVRYAPIATKFRIAAKCRDGPNADVSRCSKRYRGLVLFDHPRQGREVRPRSLTALGHAHWCTRRIGASASRGLALADCKARWTVTAT